MATWRNYETLVEDIKDGLRMYLRDCGIKYELSGCYDGWHFEIYCTTGEAYAINDFLDNMYGEE